jgi:hypothetical protein
MTRAVSRRTSNFAAIAQALRAKRDQICGKLAKHLR